MQYYKCKCGESVSFGSMGPNPCTSCSICGTQLINIHYHTDYYPKPIPHEFVIRYNESTGEPYDICKLCGTKKI